ncbi:MAG TPA: ABC transporter permease [Actinocrinis sp.]|uniref:ABC transporter permease n=1 Tax=Actinocrinis sp. TaxID=1920516 RepID=UPI002DDD1762|nr:ABC transporter permease [Actinocrinis sp.]HEV3173214.1 ABC transporter permease [Actinocrinis sp.]
MSEPQATTATVTAPTVAPADAGRLPSAVALGMSRAGIELRQYFRQRDAVVFTFAYPVIMMLIFGSIFKGDVQNTDVPYSQYFTAGIAATGTMAVGFQGVAIGIATDRTDKTIKRLRGLPMPRVSYFLGKLLSALVSGLIQLAILLGVSAVFFSLHLPTTPGRWITLAWVFVLGLGTCATLGIMLGGLAKDGRSASAVVLPPFLILQFISGVFFTFGQLGPVLRGIGAIFPLKWMCQGIRSVFLPDSFQTQEAAGSWEHGKVALVLLAWIIGGLLVSLRTFRWRGKRDG